MEEERCSSCAVIAVSGPTETGARVANYSAWFLYSDDLMSILSRSAIKDCSLFQFSNNSARSTALESLRAMAR